MNLRQLSRLLLEALLLPIAALLLLAAVLVWQLLSASQTVARIGIADHNIASASLLSALLVDEESGLRGFQATSNEILLQPYLIASPAVDASLAQLRAGIRQQGADEQPIEALLSAHHRWVHTIAEPLITRIQGGVDTRETGLNLRARAQMEGMRQILSDISSDQRQRRTADVQRWHALLQNTLIAVVGVALVLGLLIGVFARNRVRRILSAFGASLLDLQRTTADSQSSELRLRSILRSIGDAVVVCDALGRVELLNPIAESLLGRTEAQAAGALVEDAVHLLAEDTRAPLLTPISSILHSGAAVPLAAPALLLLPDRSFLQVDARASPILRDGPSSRRHHGHPRHHRTAPHPLRSACQ